MEKEKKEKSKVKKQVPLRLSKELYDEIAQWAEDEFRSMNGQIEYLLTECVKWRKRSGKRRSSPIAIQGKGLSVNTDF